MACRRKWAATMKPHDKRKKIIGRRYWTVIRVAISKEIIEKMAQQKLTITIHINESNNRIGNFINSCQHNIKSKFVESTYTI